MNIGWHSAPAYFPTGYGIQTRAFCHRLVDLGHQVVIVTTTASIGTVWEGLLHVPGGPDHPAVEGIFEWPRRLPIDIMVSLMDAWTIPIEALEIMKAQGVKWCPYAPVDHDPIPMDVEARLHHGTYNLAMSPFALSEFERVGVPNPRYLPHGVDTKIYYPRPQHKEMFQARNKFVVGIIATNIEPMDRKGWEFAFDAYGRFHEKHEDSCIYIHCNPSRNDGGLNLHQMGMQRGFVPYSPDTWQLMAHIPADRMAQFYSTFDVLMMLSGGEGFGLPLIEAQACGTPVIATEFTAPKDLVGAGWKIPVVGKRHTPMNSYWAIPDVDAAVEALEEAYDLWKSEKLRTTMRDKAVAFAADFDFDIITEKYMIPWLEEVEYGETTAPKSNERSGQEADIDVPDGGVHNSELREEGDKGS